MSSRPLRPGFHQTPPMPPVKISFHQGIPSSMLLARMVVAAGSGYRLPRAFKGSTRLTEDNTVCLRGARVAHHHWS